MKRFIVIIAVALLLSSCQRGCERMEKNLQTSKRNYTIIVYSGGKEIHKDTFTGILNGSEGSDGYYYTKDGKLIEVSGDCVISSN